MDTHDVRIVTLEPMLVISAYGYGPQPEYLAQEKMRSFLESHALLDGYGTRYPHFGFNNPSPSANNPNYGYEVWVKTPAIIEPSGDMRLCFFAGGRYAVTGFTGLDHITDVWRDLYQWRETSPYPSAQHQWLENLLNPLEAEPARMCFDLYLPIAA